MNKLIGLQYLRGIAAFLVLVDHMRGMVAMPRYVGGDPFPWLGFGAIGVDIFFVISGFIITVACFDANGRKPTVTVSSFWRHRFARIVPFLWICVGVYALSRWFGVGKLDSGPYLRAVTLWPIGEVRPNVVWTLRHEALFYLVFAVSMLWLRSRAALALWCLSPVAAALVGGVGGEWASFIANPVNLEFGAGVLCAGAYLRATPSFRGAPLPASLPVLAGLSGAMLAVAVALSAGVRTVGATTLLAAMASVLVLYSVCRVRDVPPLRVLGTLLGDASYAIYLTHGLLTLAILEALRKVAPGIGLGAAYACVVGGALTGGILVHLIVERPVVRGSQRLLGVHKP
jgi:peptidoglycan/LPS O-acetylase OafA/YrhL